MICPKCMGQTEVRCTVKGTFNERFRVCLNCNYKFQTIEAVKFDNYWKEYAKETHDANIKYFADLKKDEES